MKKTKGLRCDQSTEYNSITKLPNSQSLYQGQMMVWLLTAMAKTAV